MSELCTYTPAHFHSQYIVCACERVCAILKWYETSNFNTEFLHNTLYGDTKNVCYFHTPICGLWFFRLYNLCFLLFSNLQSLALCVCVCVPHPIQTKSGIICCFNYRTLGWNAVHHRHLSLFFFSHRHITTCSLAAAQVSSHRHQFNGKSANQPAWVCLLACVCVRVL